MTLQGSLHVHLVATAVLKCTVKSSTFVNSNLSSGSTIEFIWYIIYIHTLAKNCLKMLIMHSKTHAIEWHKITIRYTAVISNNIDFRCHDTSNTYKIKKQSFKMYCTSI